MRCQPKACCIPVGQPRRSKPAHSQSIELAPQCPGAEPGHGPTGACELRHLVRAIRSSPLFVGSSISVIPERGHCDGHAGPSCQPVVEAIVQYPDAVRSRVAAWGAAGEDVVIRLTESQRDIDRDTRGAARVQGPRAGVGARAAVGVGREERCCESYIGQERGWCRLRRAKRTCRCPTGLRSETITRLLIRRTMVNPCTTIPQGARIADERT